MKKALAEAPVYWRSQENGAMPISNCGSMGLRSRSKETAKGNWGLTSGGKVGIFHFKPSGKGIFFKER